MAIFAALALAGALAIFAFISAYQPVAAQTTSNDITRSIGTEPSGR